jgi:hypothetical protein
LNLNFAHLHVRSGFSYDFGVAMPKELISAAARMGTGARRSRTGTGYMGYRVFWRPLRRRVSLPSSERR